MFDLQLLFVIILAVGTGILTGLLPGLPAWLIPFAVIPFLSSMSIDQVLIFWLLSVIGSQYFGSIASIMFKIPGEGSTLVYITQVKNFSLSSREKLVQLVAMSSSIASILALTTVFILHDYILYLLPFLSTTEIQFFILWTVSALVCLLHANYVFSVILFCIGVFLTTKSSIALPEWIIHLNTYTYDVTVINLIVGLLIVPELIKPKLPNNYNINEPDNFKFWRPALSGTGWGMLSGFMPGPTATISSVIAYKKTNGNVIEKVISAEAANNSVVIIGGFMLLYLQIPISMDSLAVYTVITGNGWNIYDDFIQKDHTYFFATLLFGILILWVLASKSNKLYSWICTQMNNNKIFIIIISALLVIFDVYISRGSVNISNYLFWLGLMLVVGFLLKKNNITSLPLIFGFIFGDMLTWTTYQIFDYYF